MRREIALCRMERLEELVAALKHSGASMHFSQRTTSLPALLLGCLLAATGCALVNSSPYQRESITSMGREVSPRILCIVAHPDDELAFAGTLYKSSTMLGAGCDVLTITNGEGGYKYSTLAERLYGLELTDPEVGRKELPAIRRRELMSGLSVLGARDLFLLNEKDDGYSNDREHVLDAVTSPWNLARVRSSIDRVLAEGKYDFVFTHLPSNETHAHHQCATLLALEAIARIPEGHRPVILGVRGLTKTDKPKDPYTGLPGESSTIPKPNAPRFTFDRSEPFGYQGKLNYKIVVNWAIAAHRSQGTMQLAMNGGDIEEYWLYSIDDDASAVKASEFFERLKTPQFKVRAYPEEEALKAKKSSEQKPPKR